MTVGRVAEILRYPVKSMGGESLREVEFTQGGLRGDRAWAPWDAEDDSITGAKRIARLLECSARYVADPPADGVGPAEVTLPDGSTFTTDDETAAGRLSDAVGRDVSLRGLRPADDLEFYSRRGAPPADFQVYLRELFARTRDEPLPDLAAFPPEVLQYASPPGTFFDAFPLLVMTDTSLAHLQGNAPESRFDRRRFRPNLLIESPEGVTGLPEVEWVGKRVRIGGAVLGIAMACPRCVMTTHGFADLPKDPKVMRALVREAGGNLGVYAAVEEAGRVAVGDAVELV